MSIDEVANCAALTGLEISRLLLPGPSARAIACRAFSPMRKSESQNLRFEYLGGRRFKKHVAPRESSAAVSALMIIPKNVQEQPDAAGRCADKTENREAGVAEDVKTGVDAHE